MNLTIRTLTCLTILARSNKMSLKVGTNREVRFLDAIVAALTTGNPGDVLVAAFDKPKHTELILVKNGPPPSEDIVAANELISLIRSPTVADAVDLFPS